MIHKLASPKRSSVYIRVFYTFRSQRRGVFFATWGVVQIERTKKQGEHPRTEVTMSLAEQEQKVVEIMRKLDYGEILVLVKNGVPVHVEEIKKSIKL